MKLTPRKPEVDAIVELLESDEFDSAQALAKAIIKRVCELLDEREFAAWVWREESDPPFQIAFGPFSSVAEATRTAKKTGLGGKHMVLPLGSVGSLHARLDEKPTANTPCACGHSEVVHQHPGFNGRCVTRGCRCKRFVAREAA